MIEPKDQATCRDTWRANINDVATVDTLIEALGSDDGPARRDARLELVRRGFAVVPALLSALASPNPNHRWEAARALREIGDPATAPSLVRALEDDGFDVRWIAAEGLISLDQPALRPLLEALVQRPPSGLLLKGAHHVLEALSRADRLPSAVQPVLIALEGPEPPLAVPLAVQTALLALENDAGPVPA